MTIHQVLEDQARRRGDAEFILCDDQALTYGHVAEQARRVANNLALRGVGPNDKIVLLCGNCVEFLYVFLGAGRIGAVVVPVNPTLTPEEIIYIVDNCDAQTLIAAGDFGPALPTLLPSVPKVQRVFLIGGAASPIAERFDALLEPVHDVEVEPAGPHDDAALIYTSGTTGKPKGVILAHRNYIANANMLVRLEDFGEQDCFFCVLPLFHVNAQVVSVLTPMLSGGRVLLMRKFNPFAILPMIEKYRPTALSAVPTIYNVLSRIPKAGEYDISSLRIMASGAAPLPEETFLAVERVFGKRLIMGYGLSEATCASAVADPRDRVKWNSVGTPLRYTCIRIVDENGVDVPFGDVGQILIAGPTVMKGYYKNPQATEEVLKNGWLHTGDLGKFDDDGYLYVVGRVKDMIIHGGQNVYPQEVEAALSKLEGVEEVCVVGIEEPRWGQAVLAVIKPGEGHSLDERAVTEYCRKHLANYKCPRFVRFVDSLPKTATGKIRKVEVQELFVDIARAK